MHVQTHPTTTRRIAFPASVAILAIAALLAIAPATLRALAPAPDLAIPAFDIAPLKAPPAALAAITTQKYPDADTVLVDSLTTTRYAADGTYRTHDDTLVKILTEKGLRENRTRSYHYNAFYDEMTIIRAQIIHPDGTITPIDIAANTKEMINRGQMSANIYDPNNKVITLSLPGLKIGDTYQVIIQQNEKRPVIKGVFAGIQTFESFDPILHYTYEICGPKTTPLRSIAILDKAGNTITHTQRDETNSDGTIDTIHTWVARDVPQAFPEPSMPSPITCLQRILASTAADWREISKWYASICEPHLAPTQEIRAKVAELTANTVGDDEKIRAIFSFVSQEIRYMGITLEKDNPGFEPHDVSLTFDNRYGVCRDKAALLVTMLRVAGYDASPVLINAGPLIDPEVPYTRFNHAVTAIHRPDGTYQLMDSTDETTANLFPSYLSNRSYLVARSEGDTLRVSPVAPPDENMLRATTTLVVTDDGAVTGSTTLDFTGINDNAFRGSFARVKPEDIRRWLESTLKTQIPGATLTSHEVTPAQVMDTTRPLRVTFDYTAPDYFTVSQDKTLLSTPWFGNYFSIAGRILGDGTGLAKRRFPLEIPYTCGLDETLAVKLPPRIGDTLALPDAARTELPAMTYEKTFARDAQTITARLALRLRAPQVAPGADYAALKDALKDIEYSERQSPILAAKPKTELAPDTHTFSNDRTITLTDAHNWTQQNTTRKKILTYAGKKNNAELRLDYNLAWETVTLDSAQVILSDGSTRTVNPTEINIMDAGWVASAPRYPAGKTLVVSLPGVEIGSTIETKITRASNGRPWFHVEASGFGFDPVDSYTLTLNAPDTVNLATSPDFAAAKDKTTNTYHIATSRSAAPREGNLPPSRYLGPVYVATTLPDAVGYARLINDAVAPLTAPTDAIKQKAAELTAACKTDTDRVTVIRDYVARNIREAGPNFTALPLSCLTPAERTLADGYGHRADRSILLAALLRAAGFHPELFLLGPRKPEIHQVSKNIFPIWQFTDLAARVPADGKLCYLWQLSIYADLQSSGGLDDFTALHLADGTLETIKTAPRYELGDQNDYAIQIASSGDAQISYTNTGYGSDHELLKRGYTELTPENRQRAYQQHLTRLSQAAVPAGKGDFEINYDYPASMKLEATIPRYAVRSGDYLYFQLPGAETTPTPAAADTRIYPLYATLRTNRIFHWTITLPENTEVESAPENLAWIGPGDYGTVTVETKTTKNAAGRTVLEITEIIRLDPAVISAASYTSLLEINRRLSQPAQWRVLLKTK